MQIQEEQYVDPERILQQPHLLNQITRTYLQNLTNSTISISWQCITQLLAELNSRSIENEKFIMLLNSLKHILLETFPNLNGLKENRIYCWMGMIYAYRCGILIQEIEKLSDNISQNREAYEGQYILPVEQQKPLMKQLQKRIAYGLMISQIMISLVQKAGKQNTGNRVVYPELYRLIDISLQKIDKFLRPNIYCQISWTDEGRIKMTEILKFIMKDKEKEQKKKKKNGIKEEKMQEKISSYFIAKIIQVLERSFEISKKPLMKKLHIITAQINKKLQNLVNDSSESGITEGTRCLATLVPAYFSEFIEKEKVQGENRDTLNLDEIEEQNKIIYTKQLTPKFIDQKHNDMHESLKKLRKKKKKLTKRIESDARAAKFNKIQEQKIKFDVRNERVLKRQKKQIFVLQKQTEQAKKQNKKMKKIKEIEKGSKSSKFESKKGGKFDSKRGGKFDSKKGGKFDSKKGGKFDSKRGGGMPFGKTKKIRK